MEMPPLAIFIGAMKAGTTTTFQMLAEHPQMAPSIRKEISFFNEPHDDWTSLLNLFRYSPVQHKWLLDVSPNYAKPHNVLAPVQISQYPGVTVIFYALRDPVDRVQSHVAHAVKRGRWSEERRGKLINHMTNVSRYSRHIARFERLGLQPVLLDFEDIRQNPQGFVDQVTDKLGLDRLLLEQAPHRHRSQRIPPVLTASDKAAIWDNLSGDVEVLATKYSFDPARRWQNRWKQTMLSSDVSVLETKTGA